MHYSVEDNDDTLAYYAHTEGAVIMSDDNDMWRYRPQPKKVYNDFLVCRKNGYEFVEFTEAKPVSVPKKL